MPEKTEKNLSKIIEFSFYSIFLFTPLIFTKTNSEYFELPKMYFVWGLTLIIVFTWIARSITTRQIIFRRTLLDVPILLFLLSQFASFLLSIDPYISFWGDYSRLNGGILSSVSYAVLYWAFVSNMVTRNSMAVTRILLISALAVSLWSLPSHFGYDPSCVVFFYDNNYSLLQNIRDNLNTLCWEKNFVPAERIFGTLGQPNWLASWLVAIMPLAWAGVISSLLSFLQKQESSQYGFRVKPGMTALIQISLSVILSGFLLLALFYTKSDSGFLGLAISVIVFATGLLVIFSKESPWPRRLLDKQKLFVLFGIVLVLAFIFIPQIPPVQKCLSIILSSQSSIINHDVTASSDIRCILWKGAINVWQKHPLLGTGPETFSTSYYSVRPSEHNLTSEWNFLYNKAHNEYLNLLANTGIIGLISYLCVVVAFVAWSISKQSPNKFGHSLGQLEIRSIRNLLIALLAGYVGLLVTNFFGFSTVPTQLLFFLFPAIGMLLVTRNTKQEKPTSQNHATNYLSLATTPLVFLVTCYMLLALYSYFSADVRYAKSLEYRDKGEYQASLTFLREALELRPSEPLYWSELSNILSSFSIVLTNPLLVEQTQRLAIEASNNSLQISLNNISFWETRADVFTKLSSLDPKYREQAQAAYEKILTIAPTNSKTYYDFGFFFWQAGRLEEAKVQLSKAVELRPHYRDARFLLANVLWEMGEPQQAKAEISKILEFNPSDQDTLDTIKKWNQ